MRKILQWVLAATLVCGTTTFTSCQENGDNPVLPEKEEVNAERQVFEAELSKAMQNTAADLHFDAYKDLIQKVGNFLLSIDEKALKDQVAAMLPALITSFEPVQFDKLSSEEQAAVSTSLKERFNMTDEEIAKMGSFALVDAYKTIGTRKVTFEGGKATQGESDGFTVEIINAEGQSTSLTLKFNDERDGVRFFAARLASAIPVCVQLPKEIQVTMKTPTGTNMEGTLMLDAECPTRYISYKENAWTGKLNLNANHQDHKETVVANLLHRADHSFDLGLNISRNGEEMIGLAVKGMKKPYPEEYLESEELKSLRDCGSFFSAAYDVLTALNCSTIDDIEITLRNSIVSKTTINDVAGCLLAIGNIHKLSDTNPSFEDIDKYTQELNKSIHFTMGLKNSDVKAQGCLMTKESVASNNEYQPVLALQFAGEDQPQAIFDRMSKEDMDSYKQLTKSFEELGTYAATFFEQIKVKFSNFNLL